MRQLQHHIVPALILAAALVAGFTSSGFASAVASVDARAGREWMPDVARRVAELRERASRAADDARLRRSDDRRHTEWWRMVASAPAGARPR